MSTYPHALQRIVHGSVSACRNAFGFAHRAFFDFLLERACCGCGTRDEALCQPCASALPAARPVRFGTMRAYPLYRYSDRRVRDAIRRLKYRGDRSMAHALAAPMYEYILSEMEDLALFENFTEPILAPIPLAKGRTRERGFNQTELLADELRAIDSGRIFAPRAYPLAKTRETPPQTSMRGAAERARNLKNCFSVPDRKLVASRNIIILDDVLTTGATLREASRALKRAGAKNVIAVTVAH